MKRSIAILASLCFVSLIFLGSRSQERERVEQTVRIGTYDSRAIAIAYGNSEEGQAAIMSLMKEFRAAKEANNDSLVAALELRGQMHQKLMHMRAFSTAPVDEFFQAHAADVAAIARKAGVEAVVPEFELLWHGDVVKTVDLTEELAAIFHPTEQGMEWAKQTRGGKPLPLLDVLMIPANE
jgi:hypothetical protein